MSRGLHRLTDLTDRLLKSVDAAAEKMATDLQQKHDRAVRAIDGIGVGVGKPLDDAAAKAEDLLSQVTNGGPTEEVSSGLGQSSQPPTT